MFNINRNIIEYKPDMAESVADMFNRFAELWPGGFGGGIPFDEERVRDWLDDTPAIANLIALDEDDKPVGLCTLLPHWRESDAAYIGLLGVTPRVQGQKFGKNLLLKALKRAKEEGIKRVDLHTWSGNLEAVPLYKKVGMFWVPETSVYMQDYIPGILDLPIAQKWFEEHEDWYDNFERKLRQEQDDVEEDGMKIYQYRFEEDDDYLYIEVDRYGWNIKSIDYKLGDTELSVKSKLRSHDIFIGLENEFIIEIENNTGEEKDFKFDIHEYTGLDWISNLPESITVQDEEKKEIRSIFLVDENVETFDKDKPSMNITSHISFDDNEIELNTGGRIQPAVKVGSNRAFHSIYGKENKNIYFDMANKTKKSFTGYVKVNCEEFSLNDEKIGFGIGPEELSGLELPLDINDELNDHVYNIEFRPFVKHEDEYIQMPKYTHPVLIEDEDLLGSFKDKEEDKLYLISDRFKIEAELEGGDLSYNSRDLEEEVKEQMRHEIGPPYGLSIDRTLKFDHEIIEHEDYKIMKLKAESNHLPGVMVEKNVKLKKGSNSMEHWIDLKNITDDDNIETACKINTQYRGFRINPFSGTGIAYTPLKQGIVECDQVMNVMSGPMIPRDPDGWLESWTTVKRLPDNDYKAFMWEDKDVKKIKVDRGLLSELEIESKLLEPGENYESPHIWYIDCLPSLFNVRKRWNELIGKDEALENRLPMETKRPIEMKIEGTNLLQKGKLNEKKIEVDFATPYEFEGEITLDLPKGIEGSLIDDDSRVEKIDLKGFDPDKPFTFGIELEVSSDLDDWITCLNLHLSSEFEMDFEIPMIVKGMSEIEIIDKSIEDEEILMVSNGSIEYKVPAKIGGNLIDLTDSEGRTYLVDNFPEIKPRYFIENNIGGISPQFFLESEDNPFHEPEDIETREYVDGGWKGVEAKIIIENNEELKGQVFYIRYLTIPDTDLIKISIEHVNPTKRDLRWISLLNVDALLEGKIRDTKIQVYGDEKVWTRNKTDTRFSPQTNVNHPWTRIFNDDQSMILFVPEKQRGSTAYLDTQDSMFSFLLSKNETGPESEKTIEFGLALGESIDKVKLLRKVTDLI